ncbi:MAG: hypothetical protein HYZ44_13555 [Bacteroidetes bacterium]|nr:hypothetical protein [Bacteroidota bacterium]
MTIEQAKNVGQRETLKCTLYTYLGGELIFLVLMVGADFANGIIFFIDGHRNIHFLAMVTILFSVTYFAGQQNGKDILILGSHFFLTPFKYGLFTIWIVVAYASAVGLLKHDATNAISTFEKIRIYILVPYMRNTLVLLIPLLIYAYYCGDRIRNSR